MKAQKRRAVEQTTKDNTAEEKLQQKIDNALSTPYVKVIVSINSSRKPKYLATNLDGEYVASGATRTDFFWGFNNFFASASTLD